MANLEQYLSGVSLSLEQQFPIVSPRYFSDDGMSVFKCWGAHARCVGGPPSECCAPGRIGLTCAECKPWLVPAADGSCKPCDPPDTVVPVIVATMAFLLLCLVYYVIGKSNYAQQEHVLLLCAMTMSMLITLSQQLGVIATFAITWEEPLITMLSIVSSQSRIVSAADAAEAKHTTIGSVS